MGNLSAAYHLQAPSIPNRLTNLSEPAGGFSARLYIRPRLRNGQSRSRRSAFECAMRSRSAVLTGN